jgi:hypothetical protein
MPALMHLPSRHVRRLHVRAAAEDDARHAATLLSDALRTASLKGADDARLVVIRRLPLGRIPARATASSLALQIERIAADVIANAVAYDSDAASTANAVVFPDRAEAVIAMASAHARGAALDEWFWGEVVAGWRLDVPRGLKWQMLIEAAHQSQAPPMTAAAVVERAVAGGVEGELLTAISPALATEWMRIEGWTSTVGPGLRSGWHPPAGRRGDALRRWTATSHSADARLVWLATMLSVVERPACAADPHLPARIALALQPRLEWSSALEQSHELEERIDRRLSGVAADGVPDPPRVRDHVRQEECALDVRREDSGVHEIADSFRALSTASECGPAEPISSRFRRLEDPGMVQSAFAAPSTTHGGVLFLVPVLTHLDFAAFLAANPALLEAEFPARLLYEIGCRTGMAPNDPLALACRADIGEHAGPFPAYGSASNGIPAAVRDILESPPPRAPLDSAIALWLAATRRWCRRHARIGLATLVRRRARVRVTRTHIDARFSLTELDVRVRRSALDVDPGWVPWLGRVVTFTYGDEP